MSNQVVTSNPYEEIALMIMERYETLKWTKQLTDGLNLETTELAEDVVNRILVQARQTAEVVQRERLSIVKEIMEMKEKNGE